MELILFNLITAFILTQCLVKPNNGFGAVLGIAILIVLFVIDMRWLIARMRHAD